MKKEQLEPIVLTLNEAIQKLKDDVNALPKCGVAYNQDSEHEAKLIPVHFEGVRSRIDAIEDLQSIVLKQNKTI